MEILCTICARGGSKGVPNKNIRKLNGLPLIEHTIKDAQNLGKASEIVVSTDDKEIADIAKKAGALVRFLRPEELARDDAPKVPAIQHAVSFMEEKLEKKYDLILDLDPTAPLRKVKDIEKAIKIAINEDVDDVFSVCEADKNPYFNMVELDKENYAYLSKNIDKKIVGRQKAPEVYEMNASIYVYWRNYLMNNDEVISNKSKVVVMPPERSVDIDREIDFKFVEFLMNYEEE